MFEYNSIEKEMYMLQVLIQDIEYTRQIQSQSSDPEMINIYQERLNETYEDYLYQCNKLLDMLERWYSSAKQNNESIDINYFRTLKELRAIIGELNA